MKATKTELRQEIAELRNVGQQLANIALSWSKGKQVLDPDDRELLSVLRRDWDAIKRREPER